MTLTADIGTLFSIRTETITITSHNIS